MSVRVMQSAQTVTQLLTVCLLSQLQLAAHVLGHQPELVCCCLTVAAVLASSWPWLSATWPLWQLHKQPVPLLPARGLQLLQLLLAQLLAQHPDQH